MLDWSFRANKGLQSNVLEQMPSQISSLTKWFQALGTDVFLFFAVSYHVHIQISVWVDQDISTLSIKLYDELDQVNFMEIVRNSIKDQTTKKWRWRWGRRWGKQWKDWNIKWFTDFFWRNPQNYEKKEEAGLVVSGENLPISGANGFQPRLLRPTD